MSSSLPSPLLFLLLLLPFPAAVRSQPAAAPAPQQQCPLNFTALRPFLAQPLPPDDSARCLLAVQSVRLLLALHLAATGSFVLPANSSCLPPLRAELPFALPSPSACGLQGLDALLASPGCANVSTLGDFDAAVPPSSRADMNASCNRDLTPVPDCTSCTTSLSKAAAAYLLPGSPNDGGNNVTGCVQYPFIYAGAAASPRGADDPATANCLYLLKFTYDEIKAATGGFARESIIGRGGFGNVYKGVLPDGAEVAVKRFKNCSAAGDAAFAHEVEVVASVRHVNLVAIRGYCIATTEREGHQRMIVCDLMHNGSLHDHLFGAGECQMTWPVRQRIAIGMARGLAYLHRGAQPAIIHRDIKASNILLDDDFEAMVADFGLAKFAPEGMTHVSTRVAGTLGYVAPEYALYGQLTEKSDVYSFGVVLLELLSGKRAFISLGEGQNFVLSEWAWLLVRRGKTVDVIQEGMVEPGPTEVMEKYVLVAALCTHPQLHARPTMDQVVKILEADSASGPLIIPERPLPVVANLAEIERSASSSGSGQLFSPSGFRSFTHINEDAALESPKEE
uniref:non-specific serine/threonine protein kinase n=1 Tax=Oryza barthii TaxID=65489 RepID=A0A0D3EP23_9ORYZ